MIPLVAKNMTHFVTHYGIWDDTKNASPKVKIVSLWWRQDLGNPSHDQIFGKKARLLCHFWTRINEKFLEVKNQQKNSPEPTRDFSPTFRNCIKQFVITNCSKERPGSIVTETLENGILIQIVTSKESHFKSDFKYISFIKFKLTHQKLRAWKKFFIILKSRAVRKSQTLA